MNPDQAHTTKLLELLTELLELPPTFYQLAEQRYQSLGEWLSRAESCLVAYRPSVYPQGSFRYGTVIRPLLKADKYDLDLVCELAISKLAMPQREVKHMLGREVKAYAVAHKFTDPVEEKRRCWRLNYADHVSFHMDVLAAVPEDEAVKALLVQHQVPRYWADYAVAIMDKEHPHYAIVSSNWPMSNPRGFAGWFEDRMKVVAKARRETLVFEAKYASVDDVPAYEWKTPLQRAIQILKRHRDVMFKDHCDLKPISMIITALAALSYDGEPDLGRAMTKIVAQMPTFVRPQAPRIPNPVNPGEDFAERWAQNPQLEPNFWRWHTQVKADLANLARPLNEGQVRAHLHTKFAADAPEDRVQRISGLPTRVPVVTPVLQITAPAKPWARHE